MNNKLLQVAVISVLCALMFYMAGAFSAASFDISQWAPLGRVFLGFIWLLITAVLLFMVATTW